MSTDYHDFNDKLKEEQEHNKNLDEFYSRWFDIQKVSISAQYSGIDRVWTNKNSGVRYSIEYKADSEAANTGNSFVETISIDTTNKPGWAYTSCAQLLAYYVPPISTCYHFTMLAIKNNVDNWSLKYRKGKAKNKGYFTEGVLVPLSEFAKHAYKIDVIKNADKNKDQNHD